MGPVWRTGQACGRSTGDKALPGAGAKAAKRLQLEEQNRRFTRSLEVGTRFLFYVHQFSHVPHVNHRHCAQSHASLGASSVTVQEKESACKKAKEDATESRRKLALAQVCTTITPAPRSGFAVVHPCRGTCSYASNV